MKIIKHLKRKDNKKSYNVFKISICNSFNKFN